MSSKLNPFIYVVIALTLVCFAGCKGRKAADQKPVAPKATTAAPQAAAPLTEEQKVEKEIYVYDAKGRRDPFVPLILAKKDKGQKKKVGGKPIESFDVEEIKVSAITWDKKQYQALIVLPDNKSFTLKKGMTLGLYGGKVEEITKDRIIIRELIKDYKGQVKTKDTTLRLRKEGEE